MHGEVASAVAPCADLAPSTFGDDQRLAPPKIASFAVNRDVRRTVDQEDEHVALLIDMFTRSVAGTPRFMYGP